MRSMILLAAALLFAGSTAAADLARGKQLADAQCAACHGPEGNAPIDPSYPRLAGQYADYLAKVLADYKSGKRKNAVMAGMAAPLTKADIASVAAYYASRPGVLSDQKPK